MLAKYYNNPDEEKLRVSLIAFPHFQTLPSKVHKVMHSRQTGMLIDAMQHLQEPTFSEQSKSFFTEVWFKILVNFCFSLLSVNSFFTYVESLTLIVSSSFG